jgi:hypothetical protein
LGFHELDFVGRVNLKCGSVVFGVREVVGVSVQGECAAGLVGSGDPGDWVDRSFDDFVVFLGIGGDLCWRAGNACPVFLWRGLTWVPCVSSGFGVREFGPMFKLCWRAGCKVWCGVVLCQSRLVGVKLTL